MTLAQLYSAQLSSGHHADYQEASGIPDVHLAQQQFVRYPGQAASRAVHGWDRTLDPLEGQPGRWVRSALCAGSCIPSSALKGVMFFRNAAIVSTAPSQNRFMEVP